MRAVLHRACTMCAAAVGAVALLVCWASVAFGAGAGAGAGATGDGATIRLFRDVSARTNAQPAMQIVQSGYMTEAAHVGSPRSFSYRWGFGGVPAGSVRSTEVITYAQLHGRIVWVTDVLRATAPGCNPGAVCPGPASIELFMTKVAAFAGVVDRPHGTVGCFVREPFTNVPYRAGGRWWTAIGFFRPMIVRGNQILVTDTYAWSDGQHVIERDSIDHAASLFTASVFHVGRGSTSAAVPFSFSQKDTALPSAPRAPRVTLCR